MTRYPPIFLAAVSFCFLAALMPLSAEAADVLIATCQSAEDFPESPATVAAETSEHTNDHQQSEMTTEYTIAIAEAVTTYRAIADKGGWPTILPGSSLRLGDASPRVRTLRERLTITGDLFTGHEPDDLRFDDEVDAAVRRFQSRHGLESDGIIGPQTLQALNVSAAARASQLEENARRQEVVQEWEPTHLYVNTPAYELRVIENGSLVMRQRVIVGAPRTPTPEFSTQVTHAVLAPYWNVPESIAHRTIYPRAMEDPGYLARHGFVRMDSSRLRQDPGPTNFLGRIKFYIPNDIAIGLHDTPERYLFDRHQRAYSSGCIRLEEPLLLAEYLLDGTDWTMDRIKSAIERNTERWIILPRPIPIHIVYWTAWVDNDEIVQFRDDIYGRLGG